MDVGARFYFKKWAFSSRTSAILEPLLLTISKKRDLKNARYLACENEIHFPGWHLLEAVTLKHLLRLTRGPPTTSDGGTIARRCTRRSPSTPPPPPSPAAAADPSPFNYNLK